MLHLTVSQEWTEVSEVLTASIIKAKYSKFTYVFVYFGMVISVKSDCFPKQH